MPEGLHSTESKASASPEPSSAELGADAVTPLKTKPLPKVNGLAREVRVRVTGARGGDVSGERELFSESASTMLVFEKGAVIRLTAAVTPGQLLFLSNEESRREVVTQVIRKRAYRPTECYVELEFTEPAPGFWGIEFSAATALLPKDATVIAAVEMISSAETTDDELDETAPPPSAEEVESLKREIEALRSQLQQLQTQPESVQAEPAAIPKTIRAPSDTDTSQAEAPGYQTERIPWAELTADAFPTESGQKPDQVAAPSQNLAPKPALVFRKALPGRKRSFRARGQLTPGFRAGILRIAILSSILVALMGTAWYQRWVPWLQRSRKLPVSSWAGGVTTTVSPRRPVSAETQTATANPGNNPSITVKEISPRTTSSSEVAIKSTAGNGRVTGSSLPAGTIEKPVVKERSAASDSIERSSPVRSLPTKPVNSISTPSSTPGLVPPKLIQSERAIASLDDLRDFETGSVVIDAIIDTEGNVTSPRVLSGPPSLRWPALRAVKNYKYEPARENGRPVAARVTVKIQFHFVE